jgi:hypothetical protein
MAVFLPKNPIWSLSNSERTSSYNQGLETKGTLESTTVSVDFMQLVDEKNGALGPTAIGPSNFCHSKLLLAAIRSVHGQAP